MESIAIKNQTNIRLDESKIKEVVSFFEGNMKINISELSIVFLEDCDMERINWKYLRHEGTTDVITFDYSEEENIENVTDVDGEIIICSDQAQRQAEFYKVNFTNELVRLVIHGLLHLLGYNDLEKEERTLMKEKENALVNNFFKEKENYKINMES